MKKMNNKGFSLVELIVVIAIMAVLIGVLAPQFIKYVEKSRESTDITNLDTCVSAVKAYYADRIQEKDIVVSISASGATATNVGSGEDPLGEAGCKNTKLKSSKWSGFQATVKKDGGVEYAGTATYYQATTDKSGFEATTNTASPSPSTSPSTGA